MQVAHFFRCCRLRMRGYIGHSFAEFFLRCLLLSDSNGHFQEGIEDFLQVIVLFEAEHDTRESGVLVFHKNRFVLSVAGSEQFRQYDPFTTYDLHPSPLSPGERLPVYRSTGFRLRCDTAARA